MPFVYFEDDYSVHVEEMDNQHKVLIDIINEFHEFFIKGKGNEHVSITLNKLFKYVKFHFTYEENMMESIKYPGLEDHRILHQELKAKVMLSKKNIEKGEQINSIEFLHFLRDWLVTHILKDDHAYGEFILKNDLQVSI